MSIEKKKNEARIPTLVPSQCRNQVQVLSKSASRGHGRQALRMSILVYRSGRDFRSEET